MLIEKIEIVDERSQKAEQTAVYAQEIAMNVEIEINKPQRTPPDFVKS